MRFEVRINCENESFGEHGEARACEVARLLREAADRIDGGAPYVRLTDANGNTVGFAGFMS